MLSLTTEFETVPFAEALLAGARQHADRDCIVVSDDRVSYGELAERSRRVGRSLLALGIERGDRVGILMANCLDFVESLFGASLVGAVPVLYNARFKARVFGSNARYRMLKTDGIRMLHQMLEDWQLACLGWHSSARLSSHPRRG